jgi:mannose-6-phosphate isomerase-like protein (cupin superfamily)
MRRADPLRDGPAGGADAQFMLIEWVDPGGVTGPDRPIARLHVHHEDDEAWYVLEGTLGFRIGDETVEAAAGSAVFAPRGTPHSYWNAGDGPARYILVMPPRIRSLIAALHEPGVTDYEAVWRAHASEMVTEG